MSDIEISNLTYKVDEEDSQKIILDNISCTIKKGRITTIKGKSGSGKTTLIYAIAGLLNTCEGEIDLFGKKIFELKQEEIDNFRLNNIGLLFQNQNLVNFMNVEENIFLPKYIRRTNIKEEDYDEVLNYLKIFGLDGFLKKEVSSLSSCEKQRVAIVRSITNKDSLILCDEPTGMLDDANTEIFMNFIKRINEVEKTTVIIVTNKDNIYDYGDDKFIIEDGKIISTDEHINI